MGWSEGRRGVLIERSRELQALLEPLGEAREGHGGLVIVEGPAGIGKSSLLRAFAGEAEGLGVTVLRAHGDEVAMDSSYAGVRELLWSEVERRGAEEFAGAARLAEPVFTGPLGLPPDQDQVAAVLHGLHWLVADLAERGPLTLLVDDVQWLDPASVRFLAYLARRIDSLAALLVVAVRRDQEAEVAAQLVRFAGAVVRPPPLSEAGSASLVRREVGPRADETLCAACHEATGGNPFYLRALSAALREAPTLRELDAAGQIRAMGADVIGDRVRAQLQRMGEDCQRAAEAIAVLGSEAPLRYVAALAGLSREPAEAAADRLRVAELVAPSRALSFVHPIVHEAITAQIPASRRAALHARAARLLLAEDASIDRVAAHLLTAEPFGERWVVDALRAAARQALAQGAPEPAVNYLRRAMLEPPAAEYRLDALMELGRAEAMLPTAHDFPGFRQAMALAREPNQRAMIAWELVNAMTNRADNAAGRLVMEDVLRQRDEIDEPIVLRLEAHLLGGGAPDLSATKRIVARLAHHFERARRGTMRDPLMLSALAQTGAIIGLPAAEVARYGRQALSDDALLGIGPAYLGATGGLLWSDHLEEASEAQDRAIAEAQRRGSEPMFMQMSIFRAGSALFAGELDEAADYARRAYESAKELGSTHFAAMLLLPTLVERGELAEASAIAESMELSAPELWQDAIALAERGRVRIALSRLESGVEDALRADRAMRDAGCHLSVVTTWVPVTALAMIKVGRAEEARALAARELEEATAFGAPRRLGAALSVCGRLDPSSRGLEQLERAVATLEESPARLERTRALVHLGIGLQERGRPAAARDLLARSLDTAHRRGYALLAEEARAALVASGARPRREALRGPDALTPAELRAARMAAGGLSNREIAQALFVTTKTIETQLSQAYGKLGIRSRTDLADALRLRVASAPADPPTVFSAGAGD